MTEHTPMTVELCHVAVKKSFYYELQLTDIHITTKTTWYTQEATIKAEALVFAVT